MSTLRHTQRTFRRAGVTLTELVVVMAIIIVLVGLTFTMFTIALQATNNIEAQVAAANPKAGKKRPARRPDSQPQVVPNQYLVTFKDSVMDPQQAANNLATSVPAAVLHVYTSAIKGCAVRVQPGDVAALQADPSVLRVEQDQYAYACQSVFPTGVSRIQAIHAPAAPPFGLAFPGSTTPGGVPIGNGGPRNIGPNFNSGTSGLPSKAVAILDTGIDSTHPDLNVTFSKGFGKNPNGDDQNSHGTHVAGIVGAKGIGVTGVFPGVPLWALRVLGANGSGPSSDVVAGFDFAAQNASKISVVNASLGIGSVVQAVNDAATACVNVGIVVVVAAGNSSDSASLHSPASASQVICVGAFCDTDGLFGGKGAAATSGDNDDTFAVSFSCFGPDVALIAPGVDIFSTFPLSMGSYSFDTGTSMASPHVAGMAALVLSTYGGTPGSNGGTPRNLNGNGNIPFFINNPAQVLGFLQAEAVETNIKGNTKKGDNRVYPLLTGRP